MPHSPHPLTQHLQAFLQRPRIQAGSLIMTVFGDAILPRGGRIWLGSLIQLLSPLGLNERLIRTTVSRLVKAQWLHPESVGRRTDYQLTPNGRRRFEQAAQLIYNRTERPWDQQWRVLIALPSSPLNLREATRKSLIWQGFGESPNGVFLHPSADLTIALESLQSDGLTLMLPHLMPLITQPSPPLFQGLHARQWVPMAWNIAALAQAYQVFQKQYQPIHDALETSQSIDPKLAFLGRTLLIHDYRKLLLRDPELPRDLLPVDWSGHQARQMMHNLYNALLLPSNQFLAAQTQLANGSRLPIV